MTQLTSNQVKPSVIPTIRSRSDGLWGFFILTYGMMFITWGVLAIFNMSVANNTNTDAHTSTPAMLLYLIGGFTPSIAGLIMTYRQKGRAGLRAMWQRSIQFNLGSRWYLAIIAVPLLIQAGTALIFYVSGGQFSRPEFLDQPAILIPLVITTFLFGPLSEEFGWRGFAQDRVQSRWGNLRGSLLLGLLWAFWHLPLFFVLGSGQQQAGNPALIFPVYAIQVFAMTILFTWIHNNTKRSIWGAIVFHFMINFSVVLLLSVADITAEFVYLTNAGLMVLTAVIVFFCTPNTKQVEA